MEIQYNRRLAKSWAKRTWRDDGAFVAKVLNDHNRPRNLATLVDDLKTYPSIVRKSWRKSQERSSPKLIALDDKVEKQLKRYDMRYDFTQLYPPFEMQVIPCPLNKEVDWGEGQAFEIILGLMKLGEFERLRRCENKNCRKWIFAGKRKNQRFCCEKCRQARYEATPRRKKANRKRAKDYYHNFLSSVRRGKK